MNNKNSGVQPPSTRTTPKPDPIEEEAQRVIEFGDASGVAIEKQDNVGLLSLIIELAEALGTWVGLDMELVARCRLQW